MTAHARPGGPSLAPASPSDQHSRLWERVAAVRAEWLEAGLTTAPADRSATESAIAGVYARIGRPRPRFVWVPSPSAALPRTAGLANHDDLLGWLRPRPPAGRPPLASDLVAAVSRLRTALEATLPPTPPGSRKKKSSSKGPRTSPDAPSSSEEPWPDLPPVEALRAGVPLNRVLDKGVREWLRARLVEPFVLPVRAALGTAPPVCWYGQHEAPWLARFDVYRRLGTAHFTRDDEAHFDDWVTLARCGGWWWPGEHVCVAVERPMSFTPVAVYRDGWRPLPQGLPVSQDRPAGRQPARAA